MNYSRQSKGLNSFNEEVDSNLLKDLALITTLEQGGNMDLETELWELDLKEPAHMEAQEQREIQAMLVDQGSMGMFKHSREALCLVICRPKARNQGWLDLEKDPGAMGMRGKPLLVLAAQIDLEGLQPISHL